MPLTRQVCELLIVPQAAGVLAAAEMSILTDGTNPDVRDALAWELVDRGRAYGLDAVVTSTLETVTTTTTVVGDSGGGTVDPDPDDPVGSPPTGGGSSGGSTTTTVVATTTTATTVAPDPGDALDVALARVGTGHAREFLDYALLRLKRAVHSRLVVRVDQMQLGDQTNLSQMAKGLWVDIVADQARLDATYRQAPVRVATLGVGSSVAPHLPRSWGNFW